MAGKEIQAELEWLHQSLDSAHWSVAVLKGLRCQLSNTAGEQDEVNRSYLHSGQ